MNDTPRLAAVVLAAGQGSRMQSSLPKVLHPIAHRPLLAHVLSNLAPLGCGSTIVVVAPDSTDVAAAAAPHQTVIQAQPLGTGDAVRAAEGALRGKADHVIVVYGDTPLVSSATLQKVVDRLRAKDSPAVVVLGMHLENPTNYGRLITSASGQLDAIIEERDATPTQRRIQQCYAGIMGFDGVYLWDLLAAIGNQNAKGEYYLTDIVALARGRGLGCVAIEAPADEFIGINTRAELAKVEQAVQDRLRAQAMEKGATLQDPSSVYLAMDTKIGRDVVIEPHVVIGPGVTIADNVVIRAFSHIEGAHLAQGAVIGPFARLRPGAHIGQDAHIGNFVEIKNATIEPGAKANHLSYIGDADVGAKANIGAGTITCNYDGIEKHRTQIGAGAFIGSNTALVAPVTVGAGALIGAGSVIVADVPDDAIAVARSAQQTKPAMASAWRAARLKRKQQKQER